MKKPLRVWSADREKRYGIVAENFENLKKKAAAKLGVEFHEKTKLVLEEDGTVIDESYWEVLKDHTRLILLQPNEAWQPESMWPPEKEIHQFDIVDGDFATPETLFLKLQKNPAIMVLLNLNEMEMIKDTDVDQIDGRNINKEIAKAIQDKCIDLYLTRKKEEEALEIIDLLTQKKSDVCS